MDSSKNFDIKSVESDSYVCFEIVKPFCTCGRELSSVFFSLTAKSFFNTVMKDIIGEEQIYFLNTMINMKQNIDSCEGESLKFCCKLALRYGRCHTLSLEDPREGVKKDQPPVSLPGALNKRKSIYWSCQA